MRKEHVPAVVAILLLLLCGAAWQKWKKAHPPRPSPEQQAYVDVVPERAFFDNMNIRVLISAQIRPNAKISSVDFVHIGGYFVDQKGTSYSPEFTRVNTLLLPTDDTIERSDNHLLRTGETYRYCLGPARIEVDQTSEEAAAKAITRVTVYLDGQPPRDVPVVRWRGLDLTMGAKNWP